MSRLVDKINVKDKTELNRLTAGSKDKLRDMAKDVIFNGLSYSQAGKKYNISKQSVYDYLRRIHRKKVMMGGSENGK